MVWSMLGFPLNSPLMEEGDQCSHSSAWLDTPHAQLKCGVVPRVSSLTAATRVFDPSAV